MHRPHDVFEYTNVNSSMKTLMPTVMGVTVGLVYTTPFMVFSITLCNDASGPILRHIICYTIAQLLGVKCGY